MINFIIKGIKYFPKKIKKRIIGNMNVEIQKLNTRVEKLQLFFKLSTQMHGNVSFQGQIEQDLLAYLYFKGRKDGFFIDIGANDGKTGSNTYALEQLGWKGICIEPLPDIFIQLQSIRKCDCYNVAIADKSGDEIEFLRAPAAHPLSGLASQMTEAHKKRILHGDGGGRIDSIKVRTLTFDDLMKKHPDITYIDFLSIDVEGAEISILKTINFDKYSFGLITVENNEEIQGEGEQMMEIMKENGYKVLIKLEFDIVFIPNE